MCYIEIVGPSGAGKTTLRRELTADFPKVITGREGIVTCVARDSLLPLVTHWPQNLQTFIWTRYKMPEYTTKFSKECPEIELIREAAIEMGEGNNIAYFINREMARNYLFRTQKKDGEIAIIDDGLYQFHLILVEKDALKKELSAYLPIPDIFISMEIDPEICLKRQEKRDRGRASRFAGLQRKAAISQLEAMQQASKEIADELTQHGVSVIHVTSNTNKEEIYRKIRKMASDERY